MYGHKITIEKTLILTVLSLSEQSHLQRAFLLASSQCFVVLPFWWLLHFLAEGKGQIYLVHFRRRKTLRQKVA